MSEFTEWRQAHARRWSTPEQRNAANGIERIPIGHVVSLEMPPGHGLTILLLDWICWKLRTDATIRIYFIADWADRAQSVSLCNRGLLPSESDRLTVTPDFVAPTPGALVIYDGPQAVKSALKRRGDAAA